MGDVCKLVEWVVCVCGGGGGGESTTCSERGRSGCMCCVRVAPVGQTKHVAVCFDTTVVQPRVPAQLCQKKNSETNVCTFILTPVE